MEISKLERQISFFGEKGQQKLTGCKVVIIGVGGVGSHVAQQLAFLDVCNISVIDEDVLEETNGNRLIGVNAKHTMGTPKVQIIKEYIESINEDIIIQPLQCSLLSASAFDVVKTADFIFSCVDNDGARLVMNELGLAYDVPFIDVASEIKKDGEYGGHVISVVDNSRCLYCLGEIDSEEARRYLQNPDAAKDEQSIYGVDKKLLKGGGPSVVSLNGVVASMAVVEFMVKTTGIRNCMPVIKYYGNKGLARKSETHNSSLCYYC